MWRGTKKPLDEGKEGSGKSDLKLSIKQTKTIAPGPMASCQIDGEKVEVVTDFLYLDSKVTADSEIKRCFLFRRKAMTNLESILKSRDIPLLAKAHLVKAMVFPVVTYGCESWTIKKDECWRIDVFKLWCWRRLLSVPWRARGSNQ